MTMVDSRHGGSAFPVTRWPMATQVLERTSRDALGELGSRFRYPVYAYVRCCGHDPTIAEEIMRGFLGDFGARDAHPPGGVRFRRFLLDRLHAWLADDWHRINEPADAERADADAALEARYAHDRRAMDSPDQAFQRAFALEVLARALDRLRGEARQTRHDAMYDALAPFLGREPAPGQCEEIASVLRVRPLAVVLALKRLRQRLRELADAELADTVSSADEFRDEQQALLAILLPAS